jgi:uncharacterized coiled-coil DUF342 family protein
VAEILLDDWRLGAQPRRKSFIKMSLKKVKSAIEEYREKVDAKKGKIVTFGKGGPVGLQIIDVLVAELEEQDQRIQALEKKLSS